MASKVETLQQRVQVLKKENTKLKDKCNDLDAYKRRWNLWVAGVPEQLGENVKKTWTCSAMFPPTSRTSLPSRWTLHTDWAPHLERFVRATASLFSSCHALIGTRSGEMPKLQPGSKDKRVKTFEDLTPEIKDARNKLWPLVEQARKKGKKAGFRAPFAHTDDKSHSKDHVSVFFRLLTPQQERWKWLSNGEFTRRCVYFFFTPFSSFSLYTSVPLVNPFY